MLLPTIKFSLVATPLCFLFALLTSIAVEAKSTHPSCRYVPYSGTVCTSPTVPALPTVIPTPSNNGSYQVQVANSDSYSWMVWSTGQTSPQFGNAAIDISGQATGTYSYRAKRCIYDGSKDICSNWSSAVTAYVLRTPNSPSISQLNITQCDTSVGVNWLPGAGYPSGATKQYDLEESINGQTWTSRLTNSASTNWSRSISEGSSYRYRARSRYTWNGYYSAKTDWVYTNTLTVPACTPEYPPPSTPSGFSASNIEKKTGELTLSWHPLNGLAPEYTYRIEHNRNNGSWTTLGETVDPTTELPLTAITPGMYEFRIQACNPAPQDTDCSNWSSPISVDLKTVALSYKYDALGRLTELQEDNKAKAGYCYDDAGNRYQLAENRSSDDACTGPPPPPPIDTPTGLSMSSHAGNGYNIQWNPVEEANYYDLRLDKFDSQYPGDMSIYLTVQGGDSNSYSTPSGYKPVWIQACLGSICSAKAYF